MCSSLAVRNLRRGPGLVHHMMCAAVYVTTILLGINDIIGCASVAFYVERGSQISVTVSAQAYLTAKVTVAR